MLSNRFIILIILIFTPIINSATPPLQNIEDAPQTIRLKKLAVMQIGSGTGFVITNKKNQYLVTNHHIYGSKNCSKEGCFARIKTQNQTKIIQLIPFSLSKDADIIIFKSSVKFPQTLTLDTNPVQFGQSAFIVGYPRLALLKSTEAKYIAFENQKMIFSGITLPGNSGSPILNTYGHVVGIHHSAIKRKNAKFNMDSWSFSSSSSKIQKLIHKPTGLDQLHSIQVPITFQEAIEKHKIYLNSRQPPSLITQENFYQKLLTECEKTNIHTSDIEIFKQSTQACEVAKHWVHCAKNRKSHIHCPDLVEKKRWRGAWNKVATRSIHFEGLTPYPWIESITLLEKSFQSRRKIGRIYLKRLLRMSHSDLSPILALYMIKWSQKNQAILYRGQDIKQYILNHQNILGYPFYATQILLSLKELHKKGFITKETYSHHLNQLRNDPNISLNIQLQIERFTSASPMV